MKRAARVQVLTFVLIASVSAHGTALTATDLQCTIDGAQNVPPNQVPGTGSGTFVLDDLQTELTYHIEYSGLVGVEFDAHFHNATPRDNGSIVFQLPVGSPKDGVWQIPANLVTELLEGRIYVNIHTDQYVAGELRGNIMADSMGGDPTTPPPPATTLEPNYPNPFNPKTTIEYSLSQTSQVSLRIYDVAGRLIRTLVNSEQPPGEQIPIEWDGTDNKGRAMATGIYFLRLDASGHSQTRKMVLLK